MKNVVIKTLMLRGGATTQGKEKRDRRRKTQFIFSYKINPQTVLFIGYSDNHLGLRGIDITQTDRTFFFKLGYAFVL